MPASLRDLEKLAGERRDSRMKAWIRRYLRLVRMEPGRIEIELAGGAPVTLSGELTKKLFDWTGLRWVVTVAGKGGGQTLEEVDAARRAQLIAEAEADPEVAAILAALPGAKVREVRLRGEPEPEAADDDGPPLAEDDGLPERIDIDPSDLGFGGEDDDMGEASPSMPTPNPTTIDRNS